MLSGENTGAIFKSEFIEFQRPPAYIGAEEANHQTN